MNSKIVCLFILLQEKVNVSVCTAIGNSPISFSSYFMVKENLWLEDKIIEQLESPDIVSCNRLCMKTAWCTSTNYKMPTSQEGMGTCELNRHGAIDMNTRNLRKQQGATFSLLLKGCLRTGCLNGGSCIYCENSYACSCKEPQTEEKKGRTFGVGWESNRPANSCKHIRDAGDSRGDGEYWIDPENKGSPLKVYCDMTTDGGGWLLVSNLVMANSSRSVPLLVEWSYHAISQYHRNNMFLAKTAMNELRTYLNFTQLRFHCSKRSKRTFHVTTATNSIGEAVVQYFSGQTDARPNSCKSFVRMEDDNSKLAKVCRQWGSKDSRKRYVGKWSSSNRNDNRLYDHTVIVWWTYHWNIRPSQRRFDCDDFAHTVSAGDFWKVFVR